MNCYFCENIECKFQFYNVCTCEKCYARYLILDDEAVSIEFKYLEYQCVYNSGAKSFSCNKKSSNILIYCPIKFLEIDTENLSIKEALNKIKIKIENLDLLG